jgi:hypothetical protein
MLSGENDWHSVPKVYVGPPIRKINWGGGNKFLAINSIRQAFILTEQVKKFCSRDFCSNFLSKTFVLRNFCSKKLLHSARNIKNPESNVCNATVRGQ